jgi:hypothetical protein
MLTTGTRGPRPSIMTVPSARSPSIMTVPSGRSPCGLTALPTRNPCGNTTRLLCGPIAPGSRILGDRPILGGRPIRGDRLPSTRVRGQPAEPPSDGRVRSKLLPLSVDQ